jgi:hypothetical protein
MTACNKRKPDVDSVLGLLHHVVMGNVANVSEVLA